MIVLHVDVNGHIRTWFSGCYLHQSPLLRPPFHVATFAYTALISNTIMAKREGEQQTLTVATVGAATQHNPVERLGGSTGGLNERNT